MGAGRPSKYTKELAVEICNQLAKGRPLTKICKAKGMPTVNRIYVWLRDKEDFRYMYEQARLDQADTLADEIAKIADEAEENGEDPRYTKIRVDARKWVAAKLKPQKYSDRITVGTDNIDDLIQKELEKLTGSKKDA